MKYLGLICLVLIIPGSLLSAAESETAYAALRVARKVAPSAALVELSGDRGSAQPKEWKVVFSDPASRGGIKEVTVAGNEVIAQITPQHGYAGIGALPQIDLTRLNLDSQSAFSIANQQARQKQLGFHWVDYELRANSVTAEPEWILTLFDHMGARVGVIHISAENGSILMPLEIGQAPLENTGSQSAGDQKKLGGFLGAVGDTATDFGRNVSETTLRTVGTVEKFLTGERTIGPLDEKD